LQNNGAKIKPQNRGKRKGRQTKKKEKKRKRIEIKGVEDCHKLLTTSSNQKDLTIELTMEYGWLCRVSRLP
jgi:hypothetical protein